MFLVLLLILLILLVLHNTVGSEVKRIKIKIKSKRNGLDNVSNWAEVVFEQILVGHRHFWA